MRSILRSSGTFQVVKATTSRVMQPPKTTEGTRPMKRAARPLSKAPISLLEPMKT